VFALPGAGYSRRYFDLRLPGHDNYSQASYHVARGSIFVAMECAGSGESRVSHEEEIDFATIAVFHNLAVSRICRLLREGGVDGSLPAIPSFRKIGLGQSLGGAVTLITQAEHRTFDAIGVLGASALHSVLPQPEGKAGSEDGEIDWVYAFHSDDTPRDIVEFDFSGGYPERKTVPPFGTDRIPVCTFDLLSGPGVLTGYAERVDVPVFIGLGDRDTCPRPQAEPSAYRSCHDVSLFIVPRMAHMHNFACTRERLWHRLDGWWRLACGRDAGGDQ